MGRGRPRKPGKRHRVRITLTLWEGEDDDLLDFFRSLPERKRATAVKQALRHGTGLLPQIVEEDDDLEEAVEIFLL